jgi:hypothetical protein
MTTIMFHIVGFDEVISCLLRSVGDILKN